MKANNSIILFDQAGVRRQWNESDKLWYFVVIDIIKILTAAKQPSRYWNSLKKRLLREGCKLPLETKKLSVASANGRLRLIEVVNSQQMLRIVQSIPYPETEPLKLWLAQVGWERTQETEDPEHEYIAGEKEGDFPPDIKMDENEKLQQKPAGPCVRAPAHSGWYTPAWHRRAR